ncbi:uncharacterized protein LOC122722628 [Manihot esculenta]|uniref:uncharacterized protein LOC122722628 n=1 Tax=Manihot esculenta TaxID=3983 RepID=UPI001CC5F96B|nr:uncharacterized protein LOC122722628 [Manihot esculenta]
MPLLAAVAHGLCHDSSHASLKSKEFCEGRMVGQPYGVPRGDWWQQLRGRQLAGQRADWQIRGWPTERGWPAGVVGQRAWLASGRGWPTDTVGLRIRLAYGAGWPTDTVGLRKTGWPTELCQARSNWRNGLEGARSFQRQLGRAGSCQRLLVGQRKFQGSLVGLRKFQKAPERASSAQNGPVAPRIGQNWPEQPRNFQKLVGQQIQPSQVGPTGSSATMSRILCRVRNYQKVPESSREAILATHWRMHLHHTLRRWDAYK